MPTAWEGFGSLFSQLLAPLMYPRIRDAQLTGHMRNRLPTGLGQADRFTLELLCVRFLHLLHDPCLLLKEYILSFPSSTNPGQDHYGDVYFSRDWTILKLWEEHQLFYEDLPGGWYLRAVSQPLRRAAAQGTGWARGRRNAGPFTQPADAVDHAGHHPRGLRVRSRDRVLP